LFDIYLSHRHNVSGGNNFIFDKMKAEHGIYFSEN